MTSATRSAIALAVESRLTATVTRPSKLMAGAGVIAAPPVIPEAFNGGLHSTMSNDWLRDICMANGELGANTVITAEDESRLRSAPAFRRAVWGLRIIALIPLFMLTLVVLVGLGADSEAGMPVFVVGFISTAMGVGLVWSSILPMEKVKKSILPKYKLDPVERSTLMNGLLLRAAFRPGRTR